MLALLRFTLISNLIAAALLALLSWLSNYVASWMLVDQLFIVGVIFWTISTLIRLGSKRFKKEWRRNEVIVTDPQIVIHNSNWAFRFLIAGVPWFVGAILVGEIWH